MKKIILASASPRRRELLAQMNIPFEVIVSDTEEMIVKSDPQEVVLELALLKAQAVSALVEEALVIGADTIVTIDGKILGKPTDEEAAARMLMQLQGRTHEVYTGVALLIKEGGHKEIVQFAERTAVTMYPMSPAEIAAYIATGEPFDKAGAYGIQGLAAIYVEKIEGDYNNVVGLPLGRLYQEMKKRN